MTKKKSADEALAQDVQESGPEQAAQAVEGAQLTEAGAKVEPGEIQAEPAPISAEHVLDVKEAEILALRTEADEYRERWLRAAAELENFRRRTAREQIEQRERAGERILRQVLEPLDNLERAITSATQSAGAPQGEDTASGGGPAALVRGIEMVYAQCIALLEREQVRPMESVGKLFDTNLHDALMVLERKDVPANTVVEEVQRGYWLGDRVLRHAKVVVSRAPTQQAETELQGPPLSESAEAPAETPRNDAEIE